MADVSLTFALQGIVEAQVQLTKLGAELDNLGKQADPASARLMALGESLGTIGSRIALVTAPIAALGASVISSAADFESAMNQIGATSGATAEQMVRISDAARQVGADTTFSADQAAQAFLELSKANVPVEAALNGVLAATVNLAAATKTDLAFSANVAADAMNVFGANAADLPGMMDELLNATNASKFGLADMALAMFRGGQEAAALKVPFTDVNTVLALVSSGFQSGGDAGTAFAYLLRGLNPVTEPAKKAMEELGLYTAQTGSAFYDASGTLRPMPDIIGLLSNSLGPLNDEQKQLAINAIFGREAMGAVLGLMREGVPAYEAMRQKIAEHGTATAQAAALMQGFWGALEQVKGAVEDFGIAVGNAGLLEWATDFASNLADLIVWLGKTNPTVLAFGTVIAGVAVAAGPVVLAMAGFATAVGALLTPVGAAVAAVTLLGATAVAFGDDIARAVTAVEDYLGGLVSAWDGTFAGLGQVVVQAGTDLGSALTSILAVVADWATNFATSIGAAAIEAGTALIDTVSGWDIGAGLEALLVTVAGWASDFAASVGQAAEEAGAWLVDTVGSWDIASELGELLVTVAGWATDFAAAIGAAAVEAGAWLAETVSGWDIGAGLEALLATVAGWASDFAASIGSAAEEAGAWLADAVGSWDIAAGLGELLVTVADWAADFAASVGAAAETAGDWLIETMAGWDVAGALGTVLTVVAAWATDFATTVSDVAIEAGTALIDTVSGWDIAGALGAVLTVVAGWATDFVATVSDVAIEAGTALIDTVSGWDIAGALGAVLAVVAGWAADFAGAVSDVAIEAGTALIDTVSGWDIAGALGGLLVLVADWATDFAASVSAAAIEAGTELLDQIEAWDIGGALNAGLIAAAEWAGAFAVAIGQAAIEAGDALIGAIETWDIGTALGEILATVTMWAAGFVAAVVGVAIEAGAALVEQVEGWAPTLANSLGYVVGVAVVELGKLIVEVAQIAIDAAVAFGESWTGGVSEVDWTSAVSDAVAAIGEVLWDLVELAAEVALSFGEGMVTGIGDALGVDLLAVIGDAMTNVYDAVVTGLSDAYDGAMSVVQAMVDGILGLFTSIPDQLRALGQSIVDAGAAGWEALKDILIDHSVVPEMVDGILAEFDKMVEGVTTKTTGIIQPVTASFAEMSAKVTEETAKIAKTIGDSDWGLADKMAAFDELGARVSAAGEVGTAAMAALRQVMVDVVADTAGQQLKQIMDDIALSAQQQLDQVVALRGEFQQYGDVASEGLAKITEAVQKLYAELAAQEIDKIFDNQTLSIQEQAGVLEELRLKYVAMGTDGQAALAKIQPEIDAVNQKLIEQESVWYQVGTALNDNVQAWGSWAQSVGDIVSATSKSATDTLTTFFETGKLDLAGFVGDIKHAFAEEAAQAVVSFTSQAIKDFLGFGEQARADAAQTGTTMTTVMQAATGQVGGLLTGLGNVADQLFGGMGQDALDTGQTMTQAMGQATTAGQGFLTQLGNVAQQILTGMANAVQGFATGAMNLFNQIGTAGAQLWASLQTAVANFASAAAGLIQNFITGAINLFQNFGTTGSGILSTLGSAISSMAAAGTSAFSSFISSAVGGLGDMLSSGQSTSGGLIATMGEAASSILSNFSTAFGGVGTAMGQMAGSGSAALDVIAEGAKTAAGAIGGFIGDLLKFHEGGSVPHLQPDEYLAVVQGGEYVINKDAAAQYRDLVEAINSGTVDDYFDGLPAKNTFGEFFDVMGGPVGDMVGWSIMPDNPYDIGPTDILSANLGKYTTQFAAHYMGEFANKAAGLDKVTAFEGLADAVARTFSDKAKPVAGSLNAQAAKINAYSALGKFAATVVGTAIGGPVVGKVIGPVGATVGAYFSDITDEILGGWLESLAVQKPGTLIEDAINEGLLGMPKFDLGAVAGVYPGNPDAVISGLIDRIIGTKFTPLMVRDFFAGAGTFVERDVYGAIALNSHTYEEALNNWEDMVGVGAVGRFNPRADFASWIDVNADDVFGEGHYTMGWYDDVSGFFGGLFGGFIDLFDGLGGWIHDTFGGGDDTDGDGDDGGAPTGEGGGPRGYAVGGWVRDGGRPGPTDTVPAWLDPDEFVVNAAAAQAWGPLLEAINDNRMNEVIGAIGRQASTWAPLFEMINDGRFDPANDFRAMSARAAKQYRGTSFRAMATAGDVVVTRPTTFLAGEAGPERVSFTSRGAPRDKVQNVFNGPIITSDMTMNQFVRELGKRLEREDRRIKGTRRTLPQAKG